MHIASVVYDDSYKKYLVNTSLLNVGEGADILTAAMGSANSVTPLEIVVRIGKFDPSLQFELPSVLSYDRISLADHALYGSSRLGLKEYYPNQYKYEWNLDQTIAQNTAALDSSAFAYRRPWYSADYQSLIQPKQLQPYGNAHTTSIYSDRTVGMKKYELTSHLGNVMAVVTDKVTEAPAAANVIPGTAVKRASLSAAYDYYPFGMLMPERYAGRYGAAVRDGDPVPADYGLEDDADTEQW